MSTRGVVLLNRDKNRHPYQVYEIWYQHTDTYPQGLGASLLQAVAEYQKFGLVGCWSDPKPDDLEAAIEKIIENNTQEKYVKVVGKPEDAFHKVQGDLEWIYVFELDPRNARYSEFQAWAVLRMWNSKISDDFVYCVYSNWLSCLPKTEAGIWPVVEGIDEKASLLRNAFRAFGAAMERKPEIDKERIEWEMGQEAVRAGEAMMDAKFDGD